MEVAFIYNENDMQGNFKAIYYDSLYGSDHRSKLKLVEVKRSYEVPDAVRKIIDMSKEQQEKIQNLVKVFIAGSSEYNDSGNEEKDHSLLVWCNEGGRQINYYYWKNDEPIPKGVELLLEFLDKLCHF